MDDKPNSSLQQALKKRRTQVLRATEVNRSTISVPKAEPTITQSGAPAAENKRASQVVSTVSPDPRRVSQTVAAAKRTTQTLAVPTSARFQRQNPLLIAVVASVLVGIVCVGTLLFTSTSTIAPTATPKPLPTVSANDVLAYLKKARVGVANIQPVTGVSNPWQAKQALQFTAQIGDEKGVFILLSYESIDQKVPDIFKSTTNSKFKTWQVITASNVILLAAPETSSGLKTAMESHLTQYLVAPYRDFLPTATPVVKARLDIRSDS